METLVVIGYDLIFASVVVDREGWSVFIVDWKKI